MSSSYAVKIISGCLVLFAISGCNSTNQNNIQQEVSAPAPVYESLVDREVGKCNKMISGGSFTKKNAVSYHRCVIAAKEKDPLVYLAWDKAEDYKRLELAEQFSSGKITDIQFNSRMAEYALDRERSDAVARNQMQMLEYQRQTADAAQRAQALNAYLGASALMRQNTYQPVYTPVQPVQPVVPRIQAPITTNCNRFGSMTNCTTY
jgi:hypothetical protein